MEMFDNVGDDIIGDDESDCQSDTSGEPEGLTDSSSEDDTAAPGGRVRRTVWGIGRFRRVRRVPRHRPLRQISQDKQDCHASDDDCIDDLFPEDQESSGGSYAEIIEPNMQNKRTSLHPSRIEETAMIINELMNSNEGNRSGHPTMFLRFRTSLLHQINRVWEDMRHPTEDGPACRNTKSVEYSKLHLTAPGSEQKRYQRSQQTRRLDRARRHCRFRGMRDSDAGWTLPWYIICRE